MSRAAAWSSNGLQLSGEKRQLSWLPHDSERRMGIGSVVMQWACAQPAQWLENGLAEKHLAGPSLDSTRTHSPVGCENRLRLFSETELVQADCLHADLH